MPLTAKLGKPFERFSFRFHKKQKEELNVNSRSYHQSNLYWLRHSNELFPSPDITALPTPTARLHTNSRICVTKHEQVSPSYTIQPNLNNDVLYPNPTSAVLHCDQGHVYQKPLGHIRGISPSTFETPSHSFQFQPINYDLLQYPPSASCDEKLEQYAFHTSAHSLHRHYADDAYSQDFSTVMEEWMNQLKTPTPDVTLLPSPYEFNKEKTTPLERMEDIQRLQDALLPSTAKSPPISTQHPSPLISRPLDQTASPSSSDSCNLINTIPTSNDHPLVEDIASLCRDLKSQEISDETCAHIEHKRKMSMTSSAVPSIQDPSIRVKEKNSKRRKLCTQTGCSNLSRSRGLCKAHGGGRRCSVQGCTRASQSGSLCITHGGGKRCIVDGCSKAAQSRGMCKAHGGGVRCRIHGCTKSSQGDGFCRSHGGGRRCGHVSNCSKWAQRNGMCMAHSEGKYGNSYRGRMHRMSVL